MKRVLTAAFLLPFFLLLLLHLKPRAQHSVPEGKLDTNVLITFTLFPELDPFQSSEPIRASLEFDLKKFLREGYKDHYQKAVFRINKEDGDTLVYMLKIKARGEFRKTHCPFPPIKLNFTRSEMGQDYLNNVDKLKLVTHCRKSRTYQQYLFKEYLAYRMYNLLTDKSYRVRLFLIEYNDSRNTMKSIEDYGFIIESNTHLSGRFNGVIIDRKDIPTWNTDLYHANLMALFQYMIGNTDWVIPRLHNIVLLKTADPLGKPVAIPYDFDYSGMVNTLYAIPHENLGIESVRERLYRGYCLSSKEEYQEYFRKFLGVKAEMYSLIWNFELLDSKHSNEMISYLDSFYDIIEDPMLAQRHIINACRQVPSK